MDGIESILEKNNFKRMCVRFNSSVFRKHRSPNSMDERKEIIAASLGIKNLFSKTNFETIIETFPIGYEENILKAHLLFHHEDKSKIIRIISIPIVNDIFEVLGFRNMAILYNTTSSENENKIENLRTLSSILTKSFDGHDRFEEYCHNIRVAKRTKYLMDCMRNIHPDFDEIISKRPNYMNYIEKSVQLHDIGKIFIPSEILNKPAKLSPKEWTMMKLHTSFGYTLLKNISGLELAESVAMYHHEKTDGSGYFGLKGNEIPLVSRFTAVADIYDALISKRPYKEAYSAETARQILFFGKDDGRAVFSPDAYDSYIKEYLLNEKNWKRFIEVDNKF